MRFLECTERSAEQEVSDVSCEKLKQTETTETKHTVFVECSWRRLVSGQEETETTETSLIFCQSLGKETETTETKHLVFVACRRQCRAFDLKRTETK